MPQFTHQEEQQLINQLMTKVMAEAEKRFKICDILNNLPKTISPSRAAKVFGKSRTTLDSWVKDGYIRKLYYPGKGGNQSPYFVTSELVLFLGLDKRVEPSKVLQMIEYLAA